MFTVNKNPSVSDLRKFGWAMLFGFGVIGVILWVVAWRRYGGGSFGWSGAAGQQVAIGLFVLGVGLCVIGTSTPSLARPVYLTWMRASTPIGLVMSTIMLSVLFVFVLPLFSLIVRWSDPLRKKLGGKTYWEDYRPYAHTLERMRRLF
jgi:hypothetical protein